MPACSSPTSPAARCGARSASWRRCYERERTRPRAAASTSRCAKARSPSSSPTSATTTPRARRRARGGELLNGGAACYGVYRTKDGRFLSVGALEPKFWSAFNQAIGRPVDLSRAGRADEASRQQVRAEIQAILATRTRDEWEQIFAGADACVEPVLAADELAAHPQHARAACSSTSTACSRCARRSAAPTATARRPRSAARRRHPSRGRLQRRRHRAAAPQRRHQVAASPVCLSRIARRSRTDGYAPSSRLAVAVRAPRPRSPIDDSVPGPNYRSARRSGWGWASRDRRRAGSRRRCARRACSTPASRCAPRSARP